MINILIHGLGQNEKSWNSVIEILNKNNIQAQRPDLFMLAKDYQINYKNIYEAFRNYCNLYNEKLNLCGISLGGILAIDYAIEYPDKVNSIILIGTPYEIPKKALKVQNFIFKFMPKSVFERLGVTKNNFIELTNSMANLDIKSKIVNIKCHTLIICGQKDKTNIKSAKQLKDSITESKLEIIKNAGHEVNTEKPAELSKLIIKYWENLNKI